jgi:hypothetical protein
MLDAHGVTSLNIMPGSILSIITVVQAEIIVAKAGGCGHDSSIRGDDQDRAAGIRRVAGPLACRRSITEPNEVTMSIPDGPPIADSPAPPKKRKAGKIVAIVIVVLVVLCGGAAVGGYLLLRGAVDSAYVQGACVDQLPQSQSAQSTAIPKVVDCSSSAAKGTILKVADGKSAADAESVCAGVPGVSSFTVLLISGGGTKLLCLGPH